MTDPIRDVQTVRAAYGPRAEEYIGALSSPEAMSLVDRATIEEWVHGIDGRLIDAGCGPGRWAAHLRDLGADIEGIDMMPACIDSARGRFPDVTFRLGESDALPVEPASLAGILAWYSVIHTSPEQLPAIIREFARCLARGGNLLLGFFEGQHVVPFDHVITTAYFWSVSEMTRLHEDDGFEVLGVRTRTDPGARPHAAISARLRV